MLRFLIRLILISILLTKIVHDWIEEHTEETESFGDYDVRESIADVNNLYQEFRNENKKEVNYLVKSLR